MGFLRSILVVVLSLMRITRCISKGTLSWLSCVDYIITGILRCQVGSQILLDVVACCLFSFLSCSTINWSIMLLITGGFFFWYWIIRFGFLGLIRLKDNCCHTYSNQIYFLYIQGNTVLIIILKFDYYCWYCLTLYYWLLSYI